MNPPPIAIITQSVQQSVPQLSIQYANEFRQSSVNPPIQQSSNVPQANNIYPQSILQNQVQPQLSIQYANDLSFSSINHHKFPSAPDLYFTPYGSNFLTNNVNQRHFPSICSSTPQKSSDDSVILGVATRSAKLPTEVNYCICDNKMCKTNNCPCKYAGAKCGPLCHQNNSVPDPCKNK